MDPHSGPCIIPNNIVVSMSCPVPHFLLSIGKTNQNLKPYIPITPSPTVPVSFHVCIQLTDSPLLASFY